MSKVDIVRAWRDEEYRMSLSAEQLSILPESPAGSIDVSEAQNLKGGEPTDTMYTMFCDSICAVFSC